MKDKKMISLIKKFFKNKPLVSEIENKTVEKTALDKRNDFYTEFFNREISHASPYKLMAMKIEKSGIFSLYFGHVVKIELNEQGVVTPVIKDILTGKEVNNICRLFEFNSKVFSYISKLNKGQFLSLFKMADFNIDDKMKELPVLSEMVIREDTINLIKKSEFFSEKELIEDITYMPNFWNDNCKLKHESLTLNNEDEEEKAVVISQLVKDKTLLLYISNENTMPTLSIMKGAEEMRSGQLIPVAFDFGSMEDKFYFSIPHLFSETLKSCFEVMPKQILHAVLYGCEKADNEQDLKSNSVYSSYEEFSQNIEKQKKISLSYEN